MTWKCDIISIGQIGCTTQGGAMTDREHGEKEEKQEEKDEKGRGEKQRNDPLSAVVWASILIWAGVVFLVQNLGLLGQFENFNPWGLIFMGAGLILLAEALVRVLLPEYRRSVIGTVILGLIFVGIGLGNLANWGVIWALILILAGAGVLLASLFRRS
jgi:hypothetical protein